MSSMFDETILDVSCYRAQRDYLHSTDIFNAISKFIPNYTEFTMSFHRKMTSELILIPVDNLNDRARFPASILYKSAGEHIHLGIADNPSKPISKYKPYDESAVVTGMRLQQNNKAIVLSSPFSGYTFIEYIVALNKLLLNNFVGSSLPWVVSRIDLCKPPIIGKFTLRLVNTMGTRLTKTEININDEFYGYLYFSAVLRQ